MLCGAVAYSMYGRHNHGGSASRSCGLSVLPKPPKPPSWRDFISDGGDQKRQNGASKNIDFTDLNRAHNHRNTGQADYLDLSRHVNSAGHSGKTVKRTKAKIHRTRSQVVIHQSEIPDVGLTVTLAETNPKELGLRKKYYSDERIYLDANNERCQKWLAGVRACEPLEDVAFSQGTGVDVEVPDEKMAESVNLSPPNNSSASTSSSEEEREKVADEAVLRNRVNNVKRVEKASRTSNSPRREHYRPSEGSLPEEEGRTGYSNIKTQGAVILSPNSGKQGSCNDICATGNDMENVSSKGGCICTSIVSSSSDLPRVEVHTGQS